MFRPPEGFVSPVTWGVAANVQERFAAAARADDLRTELALPFEARNQAGPGETTIPATFLKVTIHKPQPT